MATRAEQAKAQRMREESARNEATTRAKKRPEASHPGRPAPAKPLDVKNRRADGGGKQTYALEESAGPRPTRKSTRASSSRAKPDSQLRRRTERRVRSPKARAEKAKAAGAGAGD